MKKLPGLNFLLAISQPMGYRWSMRTTQEKIQIAETILDQMGGKGRLVAMLGAHGFVAQDSGVSFRIKARGKGNLLNVTLDPSDTYSVELFKVRGVSFKAVDSASGVYADSLVTVAEKMLGLYLSI